MVTKWLQFEELDHSCFEVAELASVKENEYGPDVSVLPGYSLLDSNEILRFNALNIFNNELKEQL